MDAEAEFGLAFGSGMAAVDAVLSLLRPGDHVVSAEHVYGGTYRLCEQVYIPRGIDFTYVNGWRSEAFARALYAELHRCDEAGAELIVVEALPETGEWRAIADRLGRAAA